MINLFQFLFNIPKHIWFFCLKSIIAILNIIPLPWIPICSNKYFSKYSPYYQNSSPEKHLVELPLSTIHLGNFLVAYIRNSYQKRTLFKIREVKEDTDKKYKKDYEIIDKNIKRSILDTNLQQIIHDYQIIKRPK